MRELAHSVLASSLDAAKQDFDKTVESKMLTIENLDANLAENDRETESLRQDLRAVLGLSEQTSAKEEQANGL
jgi:hypothetical protein